jgi:ankyrin repeat protein
METQTEAKKASPITRLSPLLGDRARQSELMVACAMGKLALVRRLLAAGAEVNQINALGETPLTYAVAAGRRAVVRLLLAQGADLELPPPPAWSPLHYAAAVGDDRMIRTLLDAGAAVLRRDRKGRSAVDIARDKGHFRCAATIELRVFLAVAIDRSQRAAASLRRRNRVELSSPARNRGRGVARAVTVQ